MGANTRYNARGIARPTELSPDGGVPLTSGQGAGTLFERKDEEIWTSRSEHAVFVGVRLLVIQDRGGALRPRRRLGV